MPRGGGEIISRKAKWARGSIWKPPIWFRGEHGRRLSEETTGERKACRRHNHNDCGIQRRRFGLFCLDGRCDLLLRASARLSFPGCKCLYSISANFSQIKVNIQEPKVSAARNFKRTSQLFLRLQPWSVPCPLDLWTAPLTRSANARSLTTADLWGFGRMVAQYPVLGAASTVAPSNVTWTSCSDSTRSWSSRPASSASSTCSFCTTPPEPPSYSVPAWTVSGPQFAQQLAHQVSLLLSSRSIVYARLPVGVS